MVLDTPGSRTNRKIAATGRAISPGSATPKYSLKIDSPLNKVEVNCKYLSYQSYNFHCLIVLDH